jgi:hypothetical protein
MSKNILYVTQRDNQSQEAIRILTSSKIQFTPITVGIDGVGKFMWRDTRSRDVPLLLTASNIYRGLEEISQFVYNKSQY